MCRQGGYKQITNNEIACAPVISIIETKANLENCKYTLLLVNIITGSCLCVPKRGSAKKILLAFAEIIRFCGGEKSLELYRNKENTWAKKAHIAPSSTCPGIASQKADNDRITL